MLLLLMSPSHSLTRVEGVYVKRSHDEFLSQHTGH